MCGNCKDCLKCKEKKREALQKQRAARSAAELPERKMSSKIGKEMMVRSAATAGVYFAGCKYVSALNVDQSDAIKQTLVVAGIQAAEDGLSDALATIPGVSSMLSNNDWATPIELGAVYALLTSYLLKIDNRPVIMKFLHVAGSNVMGDYIFKMM